MPFRYGIQSNGEDLVGETRVLRHRLLKTKAARQEVLHAYEDEQELFDHERQISGEQDSEKALIKARQDYTKFWAREKHDTVRECCSTRNGCEICGLCKDHYARFRCLCDEGKKQLSPYRWAFVNTAIREEWRTHIWSIGEGWVARKVFKEKQPNWKDLSW